MLRQVAPPAPNAALNLASAPVPARARAFDAVSLLMHYYGDCKFASRAGSAPVPTTAGKLFLERHACASANGGMEARNKLIMRSSSLLLHRVHSPTAAVSSAHPMPRVLFMKEAGAVRAVVGDNPEKDWRPPAGGWRTVPLLLLHAKSGYYKSLLNNYGAGPLLPPNPSPRQQQWTGSR